MGGGWESNPEPVRATSALNGRTSHLSSSLILKASLGARRDANHIGASFSGPWARMEALEGGGLRKSVGKYNWLSCNPGWPESHNSLPPACSGFGRHRLSSRRSLDLDMECEFWWGGWPVREAVRALS